MRSTEKVHEVKVPCDVQITLPDGSVFVAKSSLMRVEADITHALVPVTPIQLYGKDSITEVRVILTLQRNALSHGDIHTDTDSWYLWAFPTPTEPETPT